MPTRHIPRWLVSALLPLCLLAGCIGTDFLNEAIEFADPYIALTPVTEAIVVGETLAYEATYFDSTGAAVSAPIVWTVSDVTVATIGENGVATGVGTGQARIVATAHGIQSDEALLTVVGDPNEVAEVRINQADTSVTVGRGLRFTAQVFNVLDEALTGLTVEWRTSDTAIATIDASGNVLGIAPGAVAIVATVDGVESAPAQLAVLAPSRSGSFQPRPGTGYNVAGAAFLEPRPEGGLQLRFGDTFVSSNGPDLYVYLSSASSVNAGSLEVGALQSTRGAQTYVLPAGTTISDFDYVIIHCKPFNVTFGFARL
ncbi:MAG: DM13 domain-containing protein [Rhodothermales bacterium]|nr:DM13 domain-containing protein [Rhodothermales bacterium]